jgi:PAS domain S-box-containing protein
MLGLQTDELLENLITNSPTPIFMKDPDGAYLYVNTSYEQVTGLKRDEILGRTDFDLYPHKVAATFRRGDLEALQAGSPIQREEPFVTEEGHGTFSAVKFPIFNQAGEVMGVCGVAVDITDSLRTEQVRSDERHRLAGELHDDAIQVMATVALRLETLERETEGEQQDRLVDLRETVSDALQRLRTLTSDLQEPQLEELDLRTSLEDMLETVERDHGISFSLEGDVANPTRPLVAVGLHHVAREALVNVARHAKATHVDVSLTERDEGIQLAITDDGIGFEEADARSAEHMGVSSMRSRVLALGGEVRIRSHIGEGTRIEAWIPNVGQDVISNDID